MAQTQSAPVPANERSTLFTLTVNGRPVDVAHAAASLEFASFDSHAGQSLPVEIAVTAHEPGFWRLGVEIEPWRLGIRPIRNGQTIRFRLTAPAKLSLTRPGDFLNHAIMLFLFYGSAPPPPPDSSALHPVRVIPPGVYHESLNPKSGDTIYLAPGAWLYGSLNLFHVQNIRILGRGTIVYDGPQNPNDDDGWKQIPDWHCIGSVEARNVEIDGLTCIIRSRTWSIQMKDSEGFNFNDLRVIGGNSGNANQDGMDWLGGGNTTVRDSFLRASDDVFAMQGNWDGYTQADMLRPGHDVHDILIENSVLSTSISNIVRAGWPQKIYNSRNFTLRNSDVLHAGIGACGQTFALFGFWGALGAEGMHSGFNFENLFLDHWYSLAQVEQQQPAIDGVTFKNIWALDQPPLATSMLSGNVRGVQLNNIKLGQSTADTDAEIPILNTNGAPQATFSASQAPARFTVSPPIFAPLQTVTFTAQLPAGLSPHKAGRRFAYHWFFGDGTERWGRKVSHRYPDALGTELDGIEGAGRFRVMLEQIETADKMNANRAARGTIASAPKIDWAAEGVVAISKWHNPLDLRNVPLVAGLSWSIYTGDWNQIPDFNTLLPIFTGASLNLRSEPRGLISYAIIWQGLVDIPADGGYTFYALSRDGARLVIDGIELAHTGPPFAQVCGSTGNAVRISRGSLGLRAGYHTIRVEALHNNSQGPPRILWQGPGLPLTDIPSSAFSRIVNSLFTP